MPELPDVSVYVACLEREISGRTLERVRISSPFLLRSVDPPVDDASGRTIAGIRRMGKRIVLALSSDFFLVFHLMIAGRFHWLDPGARLPGKIGLAGLDFENGTLALTEAGTKKRASLHVVRGEADLSGFDRGGLEVLDASLDEFTTVLRAENHTLRRSLTDPRLFSGIGNAYSDEILHAAKLSPLKLSQKLNDEECARLYEATRLVLTEWTDRLKAEFSEKFPGPGDITAFRPEFRAHGKYKEPCVECGTAIQRIRYAENETNYCPRCQTEDRLLADRSLSRLLKKDWPKTIDELDRGGQ